MNRLQREVTAKMSTLRTTNIPCVDAVHNLIYQCRLEGKPVGSVTLRPEMYEYYAFWVAKNVGREKVYGPDGEVASPLTCDGVNIIKGEPYQKLEIVPKFLPMDDKSVQKWKDYLQLHGHYPAHHSQIN
jgi:hypothetical protein